MKYIKALFKTIGHLIKGYVRLHKKIYTVRNFIHIDNFMATLTLWLMVLFAGEVLDRLEFLSPMTDAFKGTKITDIIYSQMGRNQELREDAQGEPLANKDIVLVNIGNYDRMGIGDLLNKINQGKPKVVGIDAFFRNEKNKMFDMYLSSAMQNTENLVLINQGDGGYNEEKNTYEELERCHPMFTQHAVEGLANMKTDKGLTICREFLTGATIQDTNYRSFPVEICNIYKPESVQKLEERGNPEELIDYVGNIHVMKFTYPQDEEYNMKDLEKEHFLTFEHKTVLNENFDPSVFEGKIVLMGYLGPRLDKDTGEDMFYTPLNDRYIGKAEKDMYGVVVHANIIETILRGTYVKEMSDFTGEVIGFILVFLVFASYRPIYSDHKIWYDGLTKMMGIVLVGILWFVIGMVFDGFDYKLNIGATYIACILLAGDFLEVYYGIVKNLAKVFRNYL